MEIKLKRKLYSLVARDRNLDWVHCNPLQEVLLMAKFLHLLTWPLRWSRTWSYPVWGYVLGTVALVATGFCYQLHTEVMELRNRVAIFDRSNMGLMVALATEKSKKARVPKILLVKPTDPVIAEIPPEPVVYKGELNTPPLAFRNKNPLNVKQPSKTQRWKGQTGVDKIGHAKFENWEDGFRASALVLKNYVTKHRISTIRGLVCRFAEGNQEEYMLFLERRLKVKRDEKVDLLKRLPEVLRAMAKFESGHDFPDRYFAPYDVVKYLAISDQGDRS